MWIKLFKALDNINHLLDGMCCHLHDNARTATLKVFHVVIGMGDKIVHSRISKTNAIHHAAVKLTHARSRVSFPGNTSDALHGNCAKQRNVVEALKLPTVAKGARSSIDRVFHLDATQINGHFYLIYHAISFASKTGPTMQADA